MIEIIKRFGLNHKLTLIPMLIVNFISTVCLSVLPFILVLIFNLIKNQYLGEIEIDSNSNKPTQFGLEAIYVYFKQFTLIISDYNFYDKITILVITFLFFSLLSSIFNFLALSVMEYREVNTRFRIRKKLRSKILQHDLTDFTKKQLGYYQSMFIKDVADLSIVSGRYMNAFFQHSFQVLICMILLLSTNIYLSMALILIFLLHIFYNKILNRPVLENTKAEYEASGQLAGKIIDYLNNFKTFKILYGQNENIQKNLDQDFQLLKKKEFHIRVLNSIQNPSRIFISNLAIILVISSVLFFLFKGEITIEVAFLFIFFARQASQPISGLSTTLLWGKQVVSAYSRLKTIFDYKPKISNGSIKKDQFSDEIEFKGVSFLYGDNKVLNDISFKIKKNSYNLVSGKNGSGKSTLLNLLIRMIDPHEGKICIDKLNIKDLDINSYQNLFSYISQDNYLIDTTIYENLIIGIDKKITNKDELNKQIRDALNQVDGLFVYDLPLKLQTRVGEGAKFLSGGEKQKICIARALLQRAEILIFDETSSGLDKNSRLKFDKMIESLKKSYTIIEVDHTKLINNREEVNLISL